MNALATTVLVIEDPPADALLIRSALEDCSEQSASCARFHVEGAARLPAALERIARGGVDVVVLDLALPGGHGIEAFEQVLAAAPDALILLLGAPEDAALAGEAVRRGAHDFFVKGHIDAHWLPRALCNLIDHQATRHALRGSEERFRAMSDASPLGIFVSDAQGNCIYTNVAYHKISGLTLEQTLGTSWSMAIHPDDRQRVVAEWQDAAHGDDPFQSEARFLRTDGSIVWTRLNAAAMNEGLVSHGRVQTVEDITERKHSDAVLRLAEEALFEEKERAQVTLNSIGDAVLTTDLGGNVTYLNKVAEAMTGWPMAEASGRPLAEVFSIIEGATRAVAADPAQRAIAEDRTVGLAMDCVLVHRDGHESAIEDSAAPIHNRHGRVTGAVIVFHDVSQSRAMTMRMAHLARYDFLTGLPNRALLTERLVQSIGQATRHQKQLALLFIDIDFFKRINDSLGHAVGDPLQQLVAERLVGCVRTTDTVCRQGGDEFVILLAEIEQPQDAANVAEKLLHAFGEPQLIDGHELHVTLSIGISIYPDDATAVDAVIQNADTAMYHAKALGRNNSQFFTPEMNARAVQRMLVESSLRRGLKEIEFLLQYQPQIDLVSGEMSGAEALIRWNDPDRGLIYPAQFIPVAEECGLIVQIGQWVMREACRQIRAWEGAGLRVVPIAVNISAVELRHKGFVDSVARILRETGIEPHQLELELTESNLMHDAASSESVLLALKALGVQLAIDDFGTGYSSLSYLRRFPIDTLKIDQSFVRDLVADEGNSTIVSAMIGMGIGLGQRVVAEGVETARQADFLRSRQCSMGQGYLFSGPLSATAFTTLMSPHPAS